MKPKRAVAGGRGVSAPPQEREMGGLLASLREVIHAARQQAVRAVDVVQVCTCWSVGRHIVEFEQGGASRAAYGKRLLHDLAAHLTGEFGQGFDASNLRYMRLFYKAFPNCDALRHELSWTHYRSLLRIEDVSARQWYMNESAAQPWWGSRGGVTSRHATSGRRDDSQIHGECRLSRRDPGAAAPGARPGVILCWAVFLVGGLIAAGCNSEFSTERDKLMEKGAVAKMNFRVVDTDGSVVRNAKVGVSYTAWDKWEIEGLTGANGLLCAEGKSHGEVAYGVEKDGYYKTFNAMNFVPQNATVKGGKWQPWDQTMTVVLKKIKKPVPMYVADLEGRGLEIPACDVPLGLDLEKVDWVAPYGKGLHGDIIVTFSEHFNNTLNGRMSITLVFGTNLLDGVQSAKVDTFSVLPSVYEAPTNDYKRSLYFEEERTRSKILSAIEPKEDEYFIFRVRSETDEHGNLLKAHYGKLYGPIHYGKMGNNTNLEMKSYFNPEEGSRNLECDTTKNLHGQAIRVP